MPTRKEIIQKANKIVRVNGTRDPFELADQLGINVRLVPFKKNSVVRTRSSCGTGLFSYRTHWTRS